MIRRRSHDDKDAGGGSGGPSQNEEPLTKNTIASTARSITLNLRL